jgi:hypothetical protein
VQRPEFKNALKHLKTLIHTTAHRRFFSPIFRSEVMYETVKKSRKKKLPARLKEPYHKGYVGFSGFRKRLDGR